MTLSAPIIESSLIPVHLQVFFESQWQNIIAAADAEQRILIANKIADTTFSQQLAKTIVCSQYLSQLWQKKPDLFCEFLQLESLQRDVVNDYFLDLLRQMLADLPAGSDMALDRVIRRLRHVQQARFIFRDANRLCSMVQLTEELSWFADACIDAVSDWHYLQLVGKHGHPIGADSGEIQPFVVLGMGKLGAYELNLSSDIDLMFCYPESGESSGLQDSGKKSIPNQTFFLRLGQKVIKSLDQVTADGFVFRVDMRLRPYGQSGALALNFDAMELYYEDQGREWERYAMIKARCVAGSKVAGAELLLRLRPFVYRRYTDFSAIQALRDMKGMINREVRRLGKQDDVKLGAGGIREIEFIIQAYQLIYGGRDEALQERSVVKVMHLLAQRGVLSDAAVQGLFKAYEFLRNAEHAIQSLNDEQTQRLPIDEQPQQRFITHLGFSSWLEFISVLDRHRSHVREEFEQVVATASDEDAPQLDEWRQIWIDPDQHSFEISLQEKDFSSPEIKSLTALHETKKIQRLQSISQDRLNAFMPLFLSALYATEERADIVTGLCDLVDTVLRRTAYLVLFNENPQALERLIVIAKTSPWALQQLVRQPVLLDELISAEGLGHVPELPELLELLQQQSLRLAVDDQEEHMQMLRYFKLAHQLHIIIAESTGMLPLMKVSDYLSFIAEAILDYVLQLAWLQMVEKYGTPTVKGVACTEADFAIIAYGKLGGLELSHSSDLDLVFLYEVDNQGDTDGEKSVNNQVFFTRMGQRIIHMLTTTTMLGRLYEVDMRLRPSGGKGLLVSTVPAFEKYQNEEAWTWEHQALVRGRAVAGKSDVIKAFQHIRQQVLAQPREQLALQQDVVKMRLKMFDHLAPAYTKDANAELFHLKHSRGGIVDIEFMVQYAVLLWAHKFPELLTYTDNIRILEKLTEAGLFSSIDAEALNNAYRHYRRAAHRQALKQAKNEVPIEGVVEQRAVVDAMWQKLFAHAIGLIDKAD